MKRFEQLHIDDQNRILLAALEMVTGVEGKSITEIAQARGVTNRNVWREICADAGFDECHPWPGFPERPTNLPPAPGGDRELPQSVQHLLDQIDRPKPH